MSKEKKKEETERNGTAELGVQLHWLGWTVQLRQAAVLEGKQAIIVLFPSQDHLQRKESWRGRNDQSAHWQLAIQFYGASTTSAAPVTKYATTSDLITFRGRKWLRQSDVVDRVVSSSSSRLSVESSPETDLIPEPCAETLPPSKYGRRRARVERDDYVSWEKIVF